MKNFLQLMEIQNWSQNPVLNPHESQQNHTNVCQRLQPTHTHTHCVGLELPLQVQTSVCVDAGE